MPDPRRGPGSRDARWVRALLVAVALGVLGLLVAVPLANVFVQAFAKGPAGFAAMLADADNRHAILVTLLVAGIAVPLNVVFGAAAAWAISKFDFPGKALLVTLIDLPLSVSPVVAGLVFVLVFGLQGYAGAWLRAHGIQVIFALPGLVLATLFVTFPFVARELLPVMEALGREDEEAATTAGASGWQAFWHVTRANVRWGLLYGVVICTARAMGEFGAVSVVSGRIPGQTDTMPLRVEKLYQDYQLVSAFALASLLTLLALGTLAAKRLLERSRRA